MKTNIRVITMLALAVLSLTLTLPASATYHWPMHVGVRCQSDFQNNWAATLPDAYPTCWNFLNQMRSTDYIDFYFNLHGAAAAFTYGNPAETCNACGGADSVDFFFMETHGGIANNNANYAGYAMWDQNSLAWTPYMRLGSQGYEIQVLATYSCDTLKTNDGRFWNRWSSPFSGGLKIVVGGHDLLWDGNDHKGTDFASRMQNGEPVGQAWNEAVWYSDNRNTPSVANTGANGNDCWNRMGSNLQGVWYLWPLRDNQIGYWCASGWNGV